MTSCVAGSPQKVSDYCSHAFIYTAKEKLHSCTTSECPPAFLSQSKSLLPFSVERVITSQEVHMLVAIVYTFCPCT